MKANLFLFLMWTSCCVSCLSRTADENAERTRRVFEHFNRHEWESMAALYADDARFLDPSLGNEYVTQTRGQVIEKYQAMETMFPDIHDEVIGVYPSGDVVTVEFVSTGRINDSVSFRLPIVSILTFRDGLIIKDATYYDQENP